jgi:predicted nucleotidyltransferase
MSAAIRIDHERIAEVCRKYHIRRLSLFGSVLRDDFRTDSDVDVLVEFEPDTVVGLRIIEIEDELSRVMDGRRIDIVSEKYLNRRLRSRVLADAELQYAEG